MEKGRLSKMSRIVGVVVVGALALPAWGAPTAQKAGTFGKVVIVAESGGDFTSPVTAMAKVATWCGSPSETNRCLVKIMPGEYDLAGGSLTMQSYVDIEGSGEMATVITSAFASPRSAAVVNGVVNGADNAEIRLLTIKNIPASMSDGYWVAIANNSRSPNITNVTAIASGGFYTCGIYSSASSPKMTNVTASASHGENNYGVYNSASSPTMSNVTASAGGPSAYAFVNCGIYNSASSPIMSNVAATGTEGHFNYGVYNDNSSSPKMSNVSATSSGTNAYAVYNSESSPKMSNVTVTSFGGTNIYGVENINSSPTMSNVTVTAWGGSGTTGVLNQSSSPTMRNVTITAMGESPSGIYNTPDSSPIMHNVRVYLPSDSGFAMNNYTDSAVTLVRPATSGARVGTASSDRDAVMRSVEVHALDKLGVLIKPGS